jgi:putative sterol carrier protein
MRVYRALAGVLAGPLPLSEAPKNLNKPVLSFHLVSGISEPSPEKFFQEVLPTLFIPDKAKGWNRVVQVTLEDDGEWILEIKDQKLTIRKGTHPRPDLELEIYFDTFYGIFKGEVFPPNAIRMGKLKAVGSSSDFLRFSSLFKFLE